MFKITEKRRLAVLPILQKYRKELHESGSLDVTLFEKELKDCWNVTYVELKDVAKQLAKDNDYKFLAAYYMENSNPGTGVSAQFKSTLAALYGVSSYDYDQNLDSAKEKFWASKESND